jgi:predicted nuclease with TOPRIM domain
MVNEMQDDKQANGWHEYSRLVLKELETLADGVEALQKELQEVRRDIAKIETRESKVDEVREWKAKMDEVVSPAQMKDLIKEHKENREFMIRAVTIIGVVQFIIATAVVWMKIFQK